MSTASVVNFTDIRLLHFPINVPMGFYLIAISISEQSYRVRFVSYEWLDRG